MFFCETFDLIYFKDFFGEHESICYLTDDLTLIEAMFSVVNKGKY